ncbi:hypothetical protein [Aneurinibacillus aneurinilyticus]|uniref:hypothetical protein n=1 Tax=Aneurinibacillus aneurinilyticus TaxID=1391 RepID=UPI0023EFF6D6|nr:hypothetical protein [Aneurinibacillus aneurinilyticus]
MEKVMYCRFCNTDHIASETMDTKGNVVGLFCNREKALIVATTTKWNDEDIYDVIERYVYANVDSVALKRIKPEKVSGLSRKIAYLFLQTKYAKERNLNYFFAQYHILDAIRRMKSRLANAKAV